MLFFAVSQRVVFAVVMLPRVPMLCCLVVFGLEYSTACCLFRLCVVEPLLVFEMLVACCLLFLVPFWYSFGAVVSFRLCGCCSRCCCYHSSS